MSYVEFKNVSKTYKTGDVSVEALKDASFEIGKGEICVIVGQSGAGKTTLLNILGGMDRLTEGEVYLDGTAVSDYNKKQLATYRRRDIGFVFQFYNLVPNLTAKENVELALQICKDPLDAKQVLCEVGLGDRLDNFPAQLSGGEQQRIALARAFITEPPLLFADEPTGNLDTKTGQDIIELMFAMHREHRLTLVLVTHDMEIATKCHRVIEIRDGKMMTGKPER